MWPRPIRAVVFDMDGLLVDTERLIYETMTEVAPAFGVAPHRETFLSMLGLPGPDSMGRMTAHYGEEFPVGDFFKAVGTRFRAIDIAEITLKAGVVELLDHLDALGIPRAICTSSSRESVDRHVGAHGLVPRFDAIVCRGDYARGKPSPDPFLAAAMALGVAPDECLALEDSHNGVRSACAAGMVTVMVPDLLEPTDDIRDLAFRIAASLHEVREWLDASA